MRRGDGLAASAEEGAAGRQPLNRLFAIYALLSGLALFFPHRPSTWPLLAVVHLGAIFWAFPFPPFGRWTAQLERRWPRVMRTLADWYPLLLLPALYTELATLNKAVWAGHYFDSLILGWEEAIFGGQPSRVLAAVLPGLALSEVLHAAYLSYYLIIYGPPLYLYLRGRRAEFRSMAFALLLVFLVHYLFFIYFPVQGPRYLFPAPDGVLATGFFYQLAHRVLEAGSSQGAAFPSSHVAVAFAQAMITVRLLPRLAPWLFVVAGLLALGAIYGGFHYATDAVAGLLLGLLLVAAAPGVRRWLGGRVPGAR